MFRDRPLACLFVIATVCVDLALLAFHSKQVTPENILAGCLYGQLSAVAIWAIRGQPHRLLRASCLVLVTALWNFLLFPEEILLFSFIYGGGIYLFTLLVGLVRFAKRDKASDDLKRNKLRVPLIEFFGWTIVVAVISYGIRYMEFKELLDSQVSEIILPLLALYGVPFLLVLFVRNDLRDLSSLGAVLIVGAALAAEWYVGHFAMILQAVYLVAWMAVLTIDNISAEASEARNQIEDKKSDVSVPQLFHPQD